MTKNRIYILIIFMLMLFPMNVKAEEDTTCNYTSKAYLNKLSAKVTANYDFKYAEDGSVYFAINIYNLTNELYAVIKESSYIEGKKTRNVFYNNTDHGTYTEYNYNTEDIYEYEIVIRTDKYGCNHDLRTLKVVKPKRNQLHDLTICTYEATKDFQYCEEWMSVRYSASREEMIEAIKTKYERSQTTVTTKPASERLEEEKKEFVKKFKQTKKYLIMGLCIGIVLDSALIFVLVRKVRRYTI